MNGELVRERDKVVRWKLIALNLAEGLDVVGKRIVDKDKEKIALFTNVPVDSVISAIDVANIYSIPRHFQAQGLDEIVVDHLEIEAGIADMSEWDQITEAIDYPVQEVSLAIVGKYFRLNNIPHSFVE